MRLFGIFLAFLIAFGSVMPHAAPAHQHPVATAHDMGKSHHSAPKDCIDCTTGCIGCAAPVQPAATLEAPAIALGLSRAHFRPTALAAFVTPLELPPPRLKA
jgi:CxxC motif-containing protein (DUF1111 family)